MHSFPRTNGVFREVNIILSTFAVKYLLKILTIFFLYLVSPGSGICNYNFIFRSALLVIL